MIVLSVNPTAPPVGLIFFEVFMKVSVSEMSRGELAARDLPKDLFIEYSSQDLFSLAVRSSPSEDDPDLDIVMYILFDTSSRHSQYIFYNWQDFVDFLRSYFFGLHRFDDEYDF